MSRLKQAEQHESAFSCMHVCYPHAGLSALGWAKVAQKGIGVDQCS